MSETIIKYDPLIAAYQPAVALFMEHFQKEYKFKYSFDGVAGRNLKAILLKIYNLLKEKPNSNVTHEHIIHAFKYMITHIRDKFILKNFSLQNINAQFNNIIIDIKADTLNTDARYLPVRSEFKGKYSDVIKAFIELDILRRENFSADFVILVIKRMVAKGWSDKFMIKQLERCEQLDTRGHKLKLNHILNYEND